MKNKYKLDDPSPDGLIRPLVIYEWANGPSEETNPAWAGPCPNDRKMGRSQRQFCLKKGQLGYPQKGEGRGKKDNQQAAQRWTMVMEQKALLLDLECNSFRIFAAG